MDGFRKEAVFFLYAKEKFYPKCSCFVKISQNVWI